MMLVAIAASSGQIELARRGLPRLRPRLRDGADDQFAAVDAQAGRHRQRLAAPPTADSRSVHDRDAGEVVAGRRRGGCPFQRRRVPGIVAGRRAARRLLRTAFEEEQQEARRPESRR